MNGPVFAALIQQIFEDARTSPDNTTQLMHTYKLQSLIDVATDTSLPWVAEPLCSFLELNFPSPSMLAVNVSLHVVMSLGLHSPVADCALSQLHRIAEWDQLDNHASSVHDDHLIARVQHAAILAMGNLADLVTEPQAQAIVSHLNDAVVSHSTLALQARRENNPNAPGSEAIFQAGYIRTNTSEMHLQRQHAVLLDALANTGNRSDPAIFLEHLRHPEDHHPLVREAAAFGLRHHTSEEVELVLAAHALKDPHSVVRQAATHAYEDQPRSYNLTHVAEALQQRAKRSVDAHLYANVSTNATLIGFLENHEVRPGTSHSRARRGLIDPSWLKKLQHIDFAIRLPGFSYKFEIGVKLLGASAGVTASNWAEISVWICIEWLYLYLTIDACIVGRP
jgi:hypothetical protein